MIFIFSYLLHRGQMIDKPEKRLTNKSFIFYFVSQIANKLSTKKVQDNPVVYYDQQTSAAHLVYWLKYAVWSKFDFFASFC